LAGESLVGQSHEVNGYGDGCQVFGVVGPATLKVVDGQVWEFDAIFTRDQLRGLMAQAQASGDGDRDAPCRGGGEWLIFT